MATREVKISIHDHPEDGATHKRVKVLGFDITRYSRTVQFFIAMTGVFVFYIIYGYVQELIFRFEEFKPFGWYLTWVQFAIYSMLALCEMRMTGAVVSKIVPMRTYLILSFLTVASMGLSNSSLGYLNYPTQVIFKSCKLIPTMIGGIFIQSKRYNLVDTVAVVSMSAGLALFTVADSSVQPTFNLYGVLLISLALCADGAIGNFQEREMKSLGVSQLEIVFFSYGIGFFIIFLGLIISGQFSLACSFFAEHPLQTYGYGAIFSVTGYIGVQFVLVLIKEFGALPAVTVTTCRKALSIVLSFLLFTKPFTLQYFWSGVLVLFGIYLSVIAKQRSSWPHALESVLKRLSTSGSRSAWKSATDVV